MSIKTFWLAAWRTATKISVCVGGVWVEVQRIQVWRTDGSPPVSGWREIYKKAGTTPPPPPPPSPAPPPPPPPAALSVTVDFTFLSGSKVGTGEVRTSNQATASATGGVGPYSFHWEVVSWDYTTPPFAATPDAATTFFDQDGMLANDFASGSFRVTGVDSLGNTGTANVDCEWETTSRGSVGGPLP